MTEAELSFNRILKVSVSQYLSSPGYYAELSGILTPETLAIIQQSGSQYIYYIHVDIPHPQKPKYVFKASVFEDYGGSVKPYPFSTVTVTYPDGHKYVATTYLENGKATIPVPDPNFLFNWGTYDILVQGPFIEQIDTWKIRSTQQINGSSDFQANGGTNEVILPPTTYTRLPPIIII